MTEVFISYHRAQRKLARMIAHRLAEAGFAVWWDKTLNPTNAWSEATINALNRSRVVVGVWSRQSIGSPWVIGEANSAFARGALVSVLSDQSPPPAPFDRAQAFALSEWTGDPTDINWTRALARIRECALTPPREVVAHASVLTLDRAPPHAPGQAPVTVRPAPRREGPYLGPPPPEPPPRGNGAGIFLATLLVVGAGAYWQRERLIAFGAEWGVTAPPGWGLSGAGQEAMTSPSGDTPAEPLMTDTALPAWEVAILTPSIRFRPLQDQLDATDYLNAAAYGGGDPSSVRIPAPKPLPIEDMSAATVIEPAADAPVETIAPPQVTPPQSLLVTEGSVIELDPPGAGAGAADLWFGPDRAGVQVYLGAKGSARFGRARADGSCGATRDTLTPARALRAGQSLCVRTTAGRLVSVAIETSNRVEGKRQMRIQVQAQ
jgi:hypothetical protein